MIRPLRSLLFAPAIDRRKVDKALSLDADAVIVDLEDAVAVAEKVRARSMVVDLLSRVQRDALYFRVNGANTPWILGDIMAVVGNSPAGIVLPKAECSEEVRRVDWLISRFEIEYGLAPGKIELIPLIESARGVAAACSVATSCTRVRRLAFGAVDYALDMGISRTGKGTELFYARSHLVVASRAAGIEGPIDTVFVNVKDNAGLVDECWHARELGFSGKLVIHPSHIKPVNDVFSPSLPEIEYAAKVVAAFDHAEAEGITAVQLDGKFVNYPVAQRARLTLNIALYLGLAREATSRVKRGGQEP